MRKRQRARSLDGSSSPPPPPNRRRTAYPINPRPSGVPSKLKANTNPTIAAAHPKSVRQTIVIEILDSSDSEDQEDDTAPSPSTIVERDAIPERLQKGKERERLDDQTVATQSSDPPFSIKDWTDHLGELDLEQLEAIVVAAKADRQRASQRACTEPTTLHSLPDALTSLVSPKGLSGEQRSTKEGHATSQRAHEGRACIHPPDPKGLPPLPAMGTPKDEAPIEEVEQAAVEGIMDILPDADRDHVMVLVCEFLPHYGPVGVVHFAIQHLMEVTGLIAEGEGQHRELPSGVTIDGASLNELGTEFFDCGCCYTQCALADMSRCTRGHAICRRCILKQAEHQCGSRNPLIGCIDISGCDGTFPDAELCRQLPEPLFLLYEKLLQQQELKEAKIHGLEQCPFCDWACIMETPKGLSSIFVCANSPDCGEISCRLCRKRQHPFQTCSDTEIRNGRLALEEAMTRALKRNCPRCDQAFIKVDGCNKMTCPDQACRAMSCYVCKAEINGYDHFYMNSTISKDPAQSACPLYDDVDQRHEMEVLQAVERHVLAHGQ